MGQCLIVLVFERCEPLARTRVRTLDVFYLVDWGELIIRDVSPQVKLGATTVGYSQPLITFAGFFAHDYYMTSNTDDKENVLVEL